MKIYKGRVSLMATEIAQTLIDQKAIEVNEEDRSELILDIESVFNAYIDTERRIHEEAQDLMTKRGSDFTSLGRFKRELAKKYNFGLDDDAIDWLTDQIIEMLFHTAHVEEIWVENSDLRRISRGIILKHSEVDNELDVEVRKKIKNLSEGSVAWDVKYQQVLRDLKRQKGL